MMCLTNFVSDRHARSMVGLSLVIFTVFIAVINWSNTIIEIICKIKVVKFWIRKQKDKIDL